MATIDRLPSAISAAMQSGRTNGWLCGVEAQIDQASDTVRLKVKFSVPVGGDARELVVGYDIRRAEYVMGSNDAAVTQAIARKIVQLAEEVMERERPGLSKRENAQPMPHGTVNFHSGGPVRRPHGGPMWETEVAPPSHFSNPCGEIALPGGPAECELEVPEPEPSDIGAGEWIGHVMVALPDGRGACAACGLTSAEIARLDRDDRCAEVLDGTVVRWYGAAPVPPVPPAHDVLSQEGEADPEAEVMAEDGCECDACRKGARGATGSAHVSAMNSFITQSAMAIHPMNAIMDIYSNSLMNMNMCEMREIRELEERARRESLIARAGEAREAVFAQGVKQKQRTLKIMFGRGFGLNGGRS